MKISGIVYDCDGVLFESRAANLAYYNRVLERFGALPVQESETERAHLCHTAASPQVFAELLGEDLVKEALTLAAALDYRSFIPQMIPQAGLVESLEQLSPHFHLAIATNRGGSMQEILSHFRLEHYFSTVVTSRDVERPKPYPDMLLLAANRLGMAVEDLLFIGDSELDAQAAGAAGMKFLAYGKQPHSDSQWIESHKQLLCFLGVAG